MAVSSTAWDEAVDRWSRVVEMGMEAALREIGCPELRIAEALKHNNETIFSSSNLKRRRNVQNRRIQYFKTEEFKRRSSVREAGPPTSSMSGGLDLGEGGDIDSNDSKPNCYTELERSTILATVGRGISGVQLLVLTGDLDLDGEFTENEATAVCVNLRSNINIKELSVRCKFFGSCTGSTLLGKAFASNPAIEALYIFQGGVGNEAVSCLMTGLQLSKTLKTLYLSENPLGDEGVRPVGEFLGTSNSTLRTLDLVNVGMTSAGVRCLLKWPTFLCSTLENLDLSENPLGDDGMSLVAEFLANSSTLKRLELQDVGCGVEGAKHVASALARNTSLEKLTFGIIENSSKATLGADCAESFGLILGALSRNDPNNRSLRSLDLFFSNIFEVEYPAYLEALTSMIATNQTLTNLALPGLKLPPKIWKERFFPALKENTTLVMLDLSSCGGLSEDVLETVIDILQNSNTVLEKIDVSNTGFEKYSAQIDEELRINAKYRSALRGQALVPTTSGRVVLCGFEFGGKTEICNTMQQIDKGIGPNSLKMSWKKLMQKFPALQRMLFGKDAYRELSSRTRGCDMLVLENHLPLKSIWDFAGQKEYYALHDYIFPDMNNSCFLFVCSCRDPPDSTNPKGKIKDKESMIREYEHWIKFLASNSKVRIGKDGQGRQLPCVIFVLTKRDTLPSLKLAISKANAEDVVKDLRRLFDGVLDLWENVEVVDGRSAEDIKHLLKVVQKILGKTLENKTEYAVCEEVRKVLGKWSAENKSKPVLKLDEYYELCQAHMTSPNPLIPVSDGGQSRAGRDVVLTYLNDVGEIIYLKGLGFIITNPRWFGVGVLGSLINAFKGMEERTGLLKSCSPSTLRDPPEHDGGFVSRRTMEILLDHSLKTLRLKQPLTTEQLTDLMLELEMCHRRDPNDEKSSLFMPALFDDPTDSAVQGNRQLQWKLKEKGPFIYLGRRLSCEDKSKTFLTPGFFPRWQVRMLNLLHEKGWASKSNPAFQIGRNLIGFTQNGIEVLIEYSGDAGGDVGYFVDILVKSSKPQADALKFVEKFIVQNIRQFCASPQGCQGVVLEASVIRPVCVKKLAKCSHRRDQCVLISFLEDQRASDPAYTHTWDAFRGGPWMESSDTSYALDLLEGEGSFDRRHKLVADRKSDIASSSGSPSSSGDDLPKLMYLSITDVGMVRELVTSLNLRKKMAIKLHLLCDNKDGSHEVANQRGRTYILNWKDSGVDLPIAKHLVTAVHSAVSVGVTLAGAPLIVPSIDGLVKLIDAPEMLAIDVETLNQNLRPGQALASASKEDICALLTSYMESDPHALGLKKFFNLADEKKFLKDFQLIKVVYRGASHEGKIGWVCRTCYWEGHREFILARAPLT